MASPAKLAVARAAAPQVEEEDDDAPPCPPVGAPAWLATFADIATNLMAFFVLILGFAKFDEVNFKKMAGSMRETFGTEIIAPILPNHDGGTVLEMNFAPQGMPPDTIEGEEPPRGDEGQAEEKSGDSPERAAAEAAAEALMEALASGQVQVEQGDKSVTIKLPEGAGQPSAESVAQALASMAGTNPTEGGSPEDTGTGEAGTGEPAPGEGGAGGAEAGQGTSPGFAKARLSVALAEQTDQGLVEVERRDGKVFVTVGAGGAFQSGSADLTDEAREIMAEIAAKGLAANATVTVTGHTDSVPLSGSPFVDNMGLGAARAAAVARELVDSGVLDPAQISAVSKGETAPVADNATEEGRAKNRRIEIEIDYAEPAAAD